MEDPALQGGGGARSFHFNSGALGLLNWVPTNLLQPGPPDCVTLLLRLTLFLGAPKSLQMVTAAMKLKDTYSLEGKL